MINELNFHLLSEQFLTSRPFNHVIIDDFWKADVADEISKDYQTILKEEKNFYVYDNPLEKKLVMNQWDKFPKTLYQAFTYLNSSEFIKIIKNITKIESIHTDIGLHGGGCHIHKTKGKLNVHLDYSIHPKLLLERKLNIIIYMTPNWSSDWAGNLELWSHDENKNCPLNCEKKVEIKFNRAVIFDTTQNSWHGLPEELNTPENIYRQSMAVYYLTEPKVDSSHRQKALYVPYGNQKDNPEIIELINKRSSENYSSVYRI